MPIGPGSNLLHCRIVEKIGEGGMGVVVSAASPVPWRRAWLAALTAVSCMAVGYGSRPLASPAEEPQAPEPVRVLFIGNSLTAANDLPGIVAALGAAAGSPLETHAVTAANFSLEDHWNQGAARSAIARGGWTWVVLQQGPSALPESQVLLRAYARRFDREIRAAGAAPALYMVWPSRARAFDFAAVSDSYGAAARDVRGRLLAAGDAWQQAWKIDRTLPLYGPDAFHPSVEGSYLAALVVYQGLTGRSPVGLPSRLVVAGQGGIDIAPAVATALQQAAAAVAASIGS